MAGIKLQKINRLAASTVLEVVVAMVIILIVFSTALTIFTNVMRMSSSTEALRAEAVLEKTLDEEDQSGKLTDGSMNFQDLRIEQTTNIYAADTLLTQIQLTAYDLNRKPIAHIQKLIIRK